MKLCKNCSAFKEPDCSIFNNSPPEGYAEKCRHFKGEEEVEEEILLCVNCERNIDTYCMRTDHPHFEYNFVKRKDGDICNLV